MFGRMWGRMFIVLVLCFLLPKRFKLLTIEVEGLYWISKTRTSVAERNVVSNNWH